MGMISYYKKTKIYKHKMYVMIRYFLLHVSVLKHHLQEVTQIFKT